MNPNIKPFLPVKKPDTYLVKGIKLGVSKILFESNDKDECSRFVENYTLSDRYDSIVISTLTRTSVNKNINNANFKLFNDNSRKDISTKKSGGIWKQNNARVIK